MRTRNERHLQQTNVKHRQCFLLASLLMTIILSDCSIWYQLFQYWPIQIV